MFHYTEIFKTGIAVAAVTDQHYYDNIYTLVDPLPLESYTAGVVSAEAGKEHHIEYYKLQSVRCRTYALTNVRKHVLEGFELCDGVHCQVFRGRNRNDSIQQAVDATHGLVIVDPDIKLIHATFHSNCGGETMNAEDLWSKQEPYLRATRDTFCLHAPHTTWEKIMARTEWLGYLNKRFGYSSTDDAQLQAVLHYDPQCRDLYLGNTWPLLPLKHVREDLKLKSTYFSVKNAEHNANFPDLPPGAVRHADHRFEWTRPEFAAWSQAVAERHGYTLEISAVGPADDRLGAPTQMGVFRRCP